MTFPRDIASAVSDGEATTLAELATDKVVLEVGTHFGFSAIVMGAVAKVLHSVDWHRGDEHAGRGDSLPTFWANLTRSDLLDKVVVHVGEVGTVLPAFRPRFFDGAFIDGFHSTEAVARDIELIRPLLKPGAWLAFHDYGRFGVAAAVNALNLPIERQESLAVVRMKGTR